jgi:hypothetical protein
MSVLVDGLMHVPYRDAVIIAATGVLLDGQTITPSPSSFAAG